MVHVKQTNSEQKIVEGCGQRMKLMHREMLEWYDAYAQRRNLCIVKFDVLILVYFDFVRPNTLSASSLDLYINIYVCMWI